MADIQARAGWAPAYSQVVSRQETVSYGGGTRAALIFASIWQVINQSLAALGWFNSTIYDSPPGTRVNHPVHFIPEQLPWYQEITPNTIGMIPENTSDRDFEVGSLLKENRLIYYIDCIGESERISMQLCGDIASILEGQLTTIGRGFGPIIDILDLDQPGHYKIGYVWIENVTDTRSPTFDELWMRYLRTVRFECLDYWDTDTDDLGVGRGHWGFLP